jgi:hypothetical protein
MLEILGALATQHKAMLNAGTRRLQGGGGPGGGQGMPSGGGGPSGSLTALNALEKYVAGILAELKGATYKLVPVEHDVWLMGEILKKIRQVRGGSGGGPGGGSGGQARRTLAANHVLGAAMEVLLDQILGEDEE